MTRTAVHLRSVRKNYEGTTVLDVDELSVERSEVLALTGPNGAGKTTLLRIMALLEQPDQTGIVTLFDETVDNHNSLEMRRRIALVAQEPFLFRGSAYDNLTMGLEWRAVTREDMDKRTKEYAAMLGLERLEQPARELSRGQGQRLALARALALEPELLLLDEPLSAMDTDMRARMLAGLKPVLTAGGRTTVLVTHDAEEVERLASRRMKMVEGRITA